MEIELKLEQVQLNAPAAGQAGPARKVKIPSIHPVILLLSEGNLEDVTAKFKLPQREADKLPMEDKLWVINNAGPQCHTLPNGQPAPDGLPALLWDRQAFDGLWCETVANYKYPFEDCKTADLYEENPPHPLRSLNCLKLDTLCEELQRMNVSHRWARSMDHEDQKLPKKLGLWI